METEEIKTEETTEYQVAAFRLDVPGGPLEYRRQAGSGKFIVGRERLTLVQMLALLQAFLSEVSVVLSSGEVLPLRERVALNLLGDKPRATHRAHVAIMADIEPSLAKAAQLLAQMANSADFVRYYDDRSAASEREAGHVA